jgi:ABC-type polysaccharide/polyol phosphate export permease
LTVLAESVGSLWRFRELLALLVSRDLKVRYKRSFLGMFWTLLNPLLQMLVYTLVFSTIMRVQIPAFPVFLLSGLLPWTLISVSATSSAHSLIANQGLIRKVAVPQAVWPIAVVGSKLVDLLFSLVPLALLAAALGRAPSVAYIALVPGLACAVAFAAGLSLLFSSLTVFFRDVRHLVDILFQVWFYLTPVLYPQSYLENVDSPAIRGLLAINPARPIVGVFQEVIYEQRFPSGSTLGLAVLCGFGTLAIGWSVFRRGQDRHIHYF